MKCQLLIVSVAAALLLPAEAHAFCGFMQEQGMAKSVKKAQKIANRRATEKVQALKRQYGKKLQLDARQVACLGGALAIDANGNQIEGDSSCTVTQGFCVNP
ncbi:MAG: hypothetical protein U1E15_09790 [Hyphomicrobiales bacterium]